MKSDIDYFQLARELGITGRASNDQLVTRCPLHPDTKPSFSLNTRSGLWTCFAGCGTGNFESLVHKVLGGTRAEALDWLAQQRALLPVPNPNLVERSIQKLGGTPQWMEIFADAGRSEPRSGPGLRADLHGETTGAMARIAARAA